MRSDAPALWANIGREILWGRRGIARIKTILFPLSVLLTVAAERASVGACFALFLSSICWSQGSILSNDLADRRDDASAGKRRWICGLPGGSAVLVTAGIFFAGLLIVFIASGGRGRVAGGYAIATALALMYSLKPFRLKERGVWGLVSYGLTCVAGYVLVSWTFLGGGFIPFAILSFAVLADKCVHLHFHQVIDYEADVQQGTRTYAVEAGIARARETLRLNAFAASALLCSVFLYTGFRAEMWWLGFLVMAGALAAGQALRIWNTSRSASSQSALGRELSPAYLGLTYAAYCILPIFLLARLAWVDPWMWLVVAAAGGVVLINSVFTLRYRYG